MNIKLSGFSNEIDKIREILKNAPGVNIVRESKTYPARAVEQYGQCYISIEFPDNGGDTNE